ncbi:helix-turn-helix transcriptional regulator [Acidithiobacillus ferrooxidans]|uniref:helix-turn-helix domain-containing protein n=1 Tax=Acidithiobacillus ferrooxidans TaxID=920 RepID=UPI001C077A86|nr:helix-turn-helix transcriptional regulator [Acidithiobacillus ferrooxidans]MBU2774486.1 helix-turn-helix transcriptional regulator [Acidithiobacillus ferrooxidans]
MGKENNTAEYRCQYADELDGGDSLSNNRSMEEKPLIATNLRYLMDLEGLSQKQLEREAGVTQATISRILKGEVKAPESSTLLPLAERFKISVEDLLRRKLDSYPFNPTSSDSATLLMVRESRAVYGGSSSIEAKLDQLREVVELAPESVRKHVVDLIKSYLETPEEKERIVKAIEALIEKEKSTSQKEPNPIQPPSWAF